MSTKQIEPDRWWEYLANCTNANQGKPVSVRSYDPSIEGQLFAHEAALKTINYDPLAYGQDIVIWVGRGNIEYIHTVDAPTGLIAVHNDDGELSALEIVDQNDFKTCISFKNID
jgi:hypothetical protein